MFCLLSDVSAEGDACRRLYHNNAPNAVYNINYHFVWCPKYRYKVLQGAVATRLIELLFELVDAMTGNMLELVVQPDHIHLFVSFPPRMAPSDIINRLKGAASR